MANQTLVDLITRIAARKQATPAQIALAWLLASVVSEQVWLPSSSAPSRSSRDKAEAHSMRQPVVVERRGIPELHRPSPRS
jgi:aryl-alcohol dehydrogenase-like predicted oxidoreductase